MPQEPTRGPSEATPGMPAVTRLPADLELIRPLGAGSAAELYLARERALDRVVAVKVLRPEVVADAVVRARFEREARAAAALNHPHVVPVYRFGELPDGAPYLVLQYVRGHSLSERLEAEGALPAAEVRLILGHVAGALAAAHQAGVLHRDIRPANVLWETEAARALVTDFGIAGLLETWRGAAPALTRAGELLGDPRYVSPEQLRGEPLTDASDVYSLGILAFQLLTGRVPHDAKSRVELLSGRLRGEVPALPAEAQAADPALADLIRRCLAPAPQHRPAAAAVARQAEARDAAPPPVALPLALPERLWSALRRRRFPQWVGGAAAGGWVMLQVVDQLAQQGLAPAATYRMVLVSVLAVIAATAVTAWYHGERGRQRRTRVERVLLGLVLVAWLAALLALADLPLL